MTHRLDRRATALAAAILLAYASVSDAQDGTKGAVPRTERPAAAAQAPATTQAVRDLRMSDLIGMDVRNAKGENLGDVTDVVVDVETGRIAYAVVGIGGFLGIGEKLSAFPMSAFRMTPASTRAGTAADGSRMMDNDGVKGDKGPIGSDRTPAEARAQGSAGPIDNDGVKGDKGPIGSDRTASGSGGSMTERAGDAASRMLSGRGAAGMHLVLDADPQRLKRAPNFESKAWPDWNDAKYRGEVDRAAGTNSAAKAGRMLRASQLLDADIQDPNSKNVGEVEDLVLDVRSSTVRYAVVDFDQAWTPDDKLVVVPMKSLRPMGEKGELVFSGDRSQLERAPSFDKGKWPDLNGGTFRGEVDRSMASWRSDAPSARGTTPGSGVTGAATDRSRGTTAAGAGGMKDPAAPAAPGAPSR
ncbi:MAG: PRC-barrel domain containing protein [Burkholderiales bacterium]|nr:MAG: PRC-barrel domain containing protein [Burkholderiales bacterium]